MQYDFDKAGLALNDGEMFNPGGKGFMRLNVGTTRAILHEALMNLAKAIECGCSVQP
jgi:cystathionine beta-lyase